MLKRRTGITILTLLMITGLAGAINDNSISKAERNYATSLMKDSYSQVVATAEKLSTKQLNFKLDANRWSVVECIYHIAGAENFLWELYDKAMRSSANPEKRKAMKFTDDQIVKMMEDRSIKAQAAEPLQLANTGYHSIEEALADFNSNRMTHIKYMKSTTEDLRNHVVELPFGWVDAYQLYIFIAAHSNRHTQQMIEIIDDISFPK